MIQTVVSNASAPEYGQATISFPIREEGVRYTRRLSFIQENGCDTKHKIYSVLGLSMPIVFRRNKRKRPPKSSVKQGLSGFVRGWGRSAVNANDVKNNKEIGGHLL